MIIDCFGEFHGSLYRIDRTCPNTRQQSMPWKCEWRFAIVDFTNQRQRQYKRIVIDDFRLFLIMTSIFVTSLGSSSKGTLHTALEERQLSSVLSKYFFVNVDHLKETVERDYIPWHTEAPRRRSSRQNGMSLTIALTHGKSVILISRSFTHRCMQITFPFE